MERRHRHLREVRPRRPRRGRRPRQRLHPHRRRPAPRATVVGEGGNLGLTQRARIDYALAGGSINADFIDNAAGVATSDREVNLKIALDTARRYGPSPKPNAPPARRAHWARSPPRCFDSCEDQVLAISLAEAQAAQLLNRHERLIDNFEHKQRYQSHRRNVAHPHRTGVPHPRRAGADPPRDRGPTGMVEERGTRRIAGRQVPDDPIFAPALRSLLPARFLRPPVLRGIDTHRLAREIIATQIADDLINHVGPGLIYQLDERLGVQHPRGGRCLRSGARPVRRGRHVGAAGIMRVDTRPALGRTARGAAIHRTHCRPVATPSRRSASTSRATISSGIATTFTSCAATARADGGAAGHDCELRGVRPQPRRPRPLGRSGLAQSGAAPTSTSQISCSTWIGSPMD